MTSKEWKKCKLGDIADVTKLAGFEFTKYINYDESGEIIALRALNLRNGILDLSDIKRIKKSVSDSLTRSKLYINDILLTYTGNGYGDCAIIKENDKYHLAPNICKISPKIEIVDPYYLYSYIRSKQFYTQMTNNMVGSGQPTIPMKTIRILEIPISSKNKQQKIAKVLSAIDDKIELNNSINNNLEQQAQAIFKSWFVDFEPFGGTMPNNWTKRTLDEFCSIFTGRKNANQFEEDGENKFFTCGPNPLKINSYIYDGPAIIISGNGAYTGRTRFYNGKFDLYQRTYACTMLENIDSDYIYLLYIIIKNVLQDKIMGGTHGSAIPYIVMNDIAKFELFYNNEIFKDLSQIMKSIVNEIMHNELENEQLTQLRDTLLPKLMSGEIDVSKVDVSEVDISTDKLYEPANESKLSAEPYNSSGSFASASKNLPSEQSSSADKLLFREDK